MKRLLLCLMGWSSVAAAVPALTSSQLVSPQVAWGTTRAGLYRSEDGGKSWRNLTPNMGGDQLQNAFFLDADHAWLTVTAPYDVEGRSARPTRILRTADGGQHWKSAALFSRGGANLSFTDRRRGTALVYLGAATGHTALVLLTTGDGGATWRKVNSTQSGFLNDPELEDGTLPDVSAPGEFALLPRFGVLTGMFGTLNQPYVFLTYDGGRSFRDGRDLLPYTPLERQTAARSQVAFAHGDWARLVSFSQETQGRSTVRSFWTLNGGRTWTGSAPLSLPPRSTAQATFTDWVHGWLRVQGSDEKYNPLPPQLYRTTNGGKNWGLLGTALPELLLRARQHQLGPFSSFADARSGLTLRLVNDRPELYRTEGGGQTWHRLP